MFDIGHGCLEQSFRVFGGGLVRAAIVRGVDGARVPGQPLPCGFDQPVPSVISAWAPSPPFTTHSDPFLNVVLCFPAAHCALSVYRYFTTR